MEMGTDLIDEYINCKLKLNCILVHILCFIRMATKFLKKRVIQYFAMRSCR